MFHGALVAAFFFLRPGALPPAPPVYRVELFAAPPGERQIGVVQDQPQPTPPPETKPVVKQPPPKPVAAKPVPKPTPKKAVAPIKQATPLPPAKAAPVKDADPPPVAGGGESGGRGADVANVQTGGL